MFTHLILTRFNTTNDGSILSNKWMDTRIHIFEKTALPSIVKQTTKNFEWIIFLNKNTQEKYKKYFNELSKKYVFITIIYIEKSNQRVQWIQHTYKNIEYLITTRFDNDDVLFPKTIETLQKQFQKQEDIFINLTKGYILRKKTHAVIFNLFRKLKCTPREFDVLLSKQKSNPFISRIEKNTKKGFKTVINAEHLQLKKQAPILQISDDYYWIQVIHGSNIINHQLFRYHRILFSIYYQQQEPRALNKLQRNKELCAELMEL